MARCGWDNLDLLPSPSRLQAAGAAAVVVVVIVLDYSRDVPLPPPSPPAAAEFALAPWRRRYGRVSSERWSDRRSRRGRRGAARAQCPLGQAADALEDVLPVEEAELHVAHASAVGRSDGLVRVEVDDAGLLGVGPAQAEGEGVGGARMVADDDLVLSDFDRGKRDGLTPQRCRFVTST